MPTKPLSAREFIALAALSTSLVAMATDSMLPALDAIDAELSSPGARVGHAVITWFFAGLALGQLVFGPLSDRLGRRLPFGLGLVCFAAGCVCSAQASSPAWLLGGRVLAGFGAAAPRVLTLAIARDLYAGAQMARVMSFVSAVFIVVPALAPSVGQALAGWFGWRAVFTSLAAAAAVDLAWFWLRQPETSATRTPLSSVYSGIRRALAEPVFVVATLGAGFVFGAFIAYLSTTQALFTQLYGERERFPVLFAALALALGAGSLFNARRLRAQPLRQVTRRGLTALLLVAVAATGLDLAFQGAPPLAVFMVATGALFFVHGPSFGNLSALAMEPLAGRAGLAASLSGSLATAVGFAVGRAFAAGYTGHTTSVHLAFACAAGAALLALSLAARLRPA